MADVKIESSWKAVLETEFEKDYFQNLIAFLKKEKEDQKEVYPPGNLIFNAFDLTPIDQTRVVILGQDPYHGKGQAMGLCFSVPDGVKAPPSLVRIYKEIESDVGVKPSKSGNLTKWGEQGVLLLNAMLTVRASQAGSHQNKGWETFTDAVIQKLSDTKENLVFLLWGNYAKVKGRIIDKTKHLVLEAAHPSPMAGDAFFGCKHFSQTNAYLEQHGYQAIDWSVE